MGGRANGQAFADGEQVPHIGASRNLYKTNVNKDMFFCEMLEFKTHHFYQYL
jgi:hypothetical protein